MKGKFRFLDNQACCTVKVVSNPYFKPNVTYNLDFMLTDFKTLGNKNSEQVRAAFVSRDDAQSPANLKQV